MVNLNNNAPFKKNGGRYCTAKYSVSNISPKFATVFEL